MLENNKLSLLASTTFCLHLTCKLLPTNYVHLLVKLPTWHDLIGNRIITSAIMTCLFVPFRLEILSIVNECKFYSEATESVENDGPGQCK